jgi:predicted dehydrogenase
MNGEGRLRVAVVGVGHLGRHHARILAELDGVELVGVADTDIERARQVAEAARTQATADFREFLGRADAVTVAVPTASHLDAALPFLERGVPVLVEKPLALTLDEADRMMAAAARSGAMLAVGHTERHNPAVAAARSIVDRPRFIEVHRLGVFPDRSLDIDVVFDLMIHDLDVVASLVGQDVVSIEAVGVPVLTNRIDIANVRLRFADGCIANLTASRISRDRVRKIRIFQADAYISIDYAAQELEVYRLARREGMRPSIEGGQVNVPHEEPLRRELADFRDAIIGRRPPAVTAQDGRLALSFAQQITDLMMNGV